jgi:prepilin-type N-terminal cleavage/methylation domain-containing protein
MKFSIFSRLKRDSKKSGFTLVELLVTITVFSIAITGFVGLFGSALKHQRESLLSNYLLSSGSYITEYMSRALRMAQKELANPPTCLSVRGLNYEITRQGNGIKFINFNSECQEFYLENSILKVEKNGISQDLTPSNLIVENLNFSLLGKSQADQIQPRVTFTLKLKTAQTPSQEINLQTTVSQRELDVQY